MKKTSEDIKFLFIGICVFIISYFFPSVIPSKVSSGLNDLACSYLYYFKAKPLKDVKLISIVVDEYSLDKIPLRWPWKRSVYASLLKILAQEQVRVVGIDFTFVGESENKEDDTLLAHALNNPSSRVVLAHFFDYKTATAILPEPGLREASYSIGMVNTPQDSDSRTRRLRAYVELDGNFYYSFAVALSAAFLNQAPQTVISGIPLLKDKTFFINYLLKARDTITLSFYDVLENLGDLKQRYGSGFLQDALVVVYPDAGIFHDIHYTPLGRMSGGLIHLNGVAGIIGKRFIKDSNIALLVFLIFSLGAIFYILKTRGFICGVLFTIGVLIFNFWLLIALELAGVKFDYSRVVFFGFLFFTSGSLYKYIHFLAQLVKIKVKATSDPLRGLFNLRYFLYRLELESKNIHLYKDMLLVFMYLESFQGATEDFALDKMRNIWQKIKSIIYLKGSFWSVFSAEELIGCVIGHKANTGRSLEAIKDNLEDLFKRYNIKSKVRLGYLRFNKEYNIRGLSYALFGRLKKEGLQIVLFNENELRELLLASDIHLPEKAGFFLEGLDEDIEEKNRDLLALIESLNREHAKTKEAFFEIIASLVNALEARDAYTQGHSRRVADYAFKMADKLGWPSLEKEKLRKAALLHDLGKIGIPDSILHNKGTLSNEEYELIKKHEIIAVKILEPLKEMSEILPWILYHHERWDGKGYPKGLSGEAIPQASQIISLCDAYDALIAGREYRAAFTEQEVIAEIIKNKGTQFNPHLTDVFVEAIFTIKSDNRENSLREKSQNTAD